MSTRNTRLDRLQGALVTREVGRFAGLPVRLVDLIVAVTGVGATVCIVLSGQAKKGHRFSIGPVHISKGWLLTTGFILLGVGALWGLLLRWRHERLEERNRELAVQIADSDKRERHAWRLVGELMRAELALILKENKLWSDERVSFFIDDPDGSGLLLAGRWSHMPDYRAVKERSPYPYEHGCVGRAWRKGRVIYVTDLPDPTADLAAWQAALATEWDIPPDASAEMTMRSRTVYAQRIEAGVGEAPLGVVSIESTQVPRRESGHRLELECESFEAYFADKLDMIERLLELAAELRAALQSPALPSIRPGPLKRAGKRVVGVAMRLRSRDAQPRSTG